MRADDKKRLAYIRQLLGDLPNGALGGDTVAFLLRLLDSEREACARIADKEARVGPGGASCENDAASIRQIVTAKHIADAIRSRP